MDAQTYYNGVDDWGGSSFADDQSRSCEECCCPQKNILTPADFGY
jgi:hypothetical protein